MLKAWAIVDETCRWGRRYYAPYRRQWCETLHPADLIVDRWLAEALACRLGRGVVVPYVIRPLAEDRAASGRGEKGSSPARLRRDERDVSRNGRDDD